MGSYFCKDCNTWHNDMASDICPKIRDKRRKNKECPECGKKIKDNVVYEDDYYYCNHCKYHALDYYYSEKILNKMIKI